jgi:hypothetical protein
MSIMLSGGWRETILQDDFICPSRRLNDAWDARHHYTGMPQHSVGVRRAR